MSTIVEAECLTKRFGDLTAIDSISFSLEAGKIYGLLGRNGSGKTTLLRLLTAQLFATGGTLLVFGEQPYENRRVLSQICFMKENQTYPKRWRVGDVLGFHLPYLSDGSLIEQLCIYFVVMANLYFLGFVIGSIYRRFGRAGTLMFFLIVFLLMSIFTLVWTYLRWWGAFFHWFSQFTAFELALLLLPLTALYLLASYLLLRRAVA